MVVDWIGVGIAAMAAGLGGWGISRRQMNGKLKRARDAGGETEAINTLKVDMADNKTDHKIIFKKLDEMPDRIVARLKDSP